MKFPDRSFLKIVVVLISGIIFSLIGQFFTKAPVDRYIHIRNFRYGKDPWVIRCNRGDRLHLTFSSEDTGHSFFLEEFNIDAKIEPSSDEVVVFNPRDPSIPPVYTKEVVITAELPGIKKYFFSRFNYRCHVWCGPMHAFEQGKLIIMPDTLLWFGAGSMLAIIILWLISFSTSLSKEAEQVYLPPWAEKLFKSRWPQIIFMLIALFMITLVVTTTILGTKVSGRNLGVLLMWSVWLFLLITFLTPLGGRIWCTICPLPLFGDLIQRGSLFAPLKGKRGNYNSSFFGFFRKWPAKLENNWIRLFLFMLLATFSTTLVAIPRISGFAILLLIILPTLMSVFWELRSFCRYVCPVHAFVGPFSGLGLIHITTRSKEVCAACKPEYCRNGNSLGWACPYGLNAGEIKDSADCGMCLECLRSCSFNNVTVGRRGFASQQVIPATSTGWLNIAIFSIAVVYSVLYLGPWPAVRDWVNIIDKQNWAYFGLYSLSLWVLVLILVPGLIYLLALLGKKISRASVSTEHIFRGYTSSILPLGLMLWIAFVIPMLFVNVTFISQSFSDPFGWGWDFFGTANTPWHQFLPEFIPWLQVIFLLSGLFLSLRNLGRLFQGEEQSLQKALIKVLPVAIFLIAVTASMIFFFAA